jgi:murein DD-endopeptidase MepM/ murein hydrolase activator NlpD
VSTHKQTNSQRKYRPHQQAVRHHEQLELEPRKDFFVFLRNLSFFKRLTRNSAPFQNKHHVALGVFIMLAFLAFVVIPTSATVRPALSKLGPRVTQAVALPLPALSSKAQPIEPVIFADWRQVEVKPGQTMGDIFAEQGGSANLLHRLIDDERYKQSLTQIKPKQVFDFLRNANGDIEALRFDLNENEQVTVHFENDSLREELIKRHIERRILVASGQIERSLFTDGEAAGMPDAMILKMANVFAYDIDFAQDLRRGDQFSVVYERIYQDGLPLRDGEVLAATFINQGKRHVALRFEQKDGTAGFFDLEGRSLRKDFLRTPVEFSRISSRFSLGRKHPILGLMRAHRGVDYAAPTGTPIHSAGKGKIRFRGWKSGYGNVVEIDHGRGYSTLYGHMSRFASTLRSGQSVAQGQVIGYVGMTGLATGPHLHYEFRVSGAHRDPLTVTLPKAEPLAGKELLSFQAQTSPLMSQLLALEQRLVASVAR